MSIRTAATTGQKPKLNLKIEARKGCFDMCLVQLKWNVHLTSDCTLTAWIRCTNVANDWQAFSFSKPSRKDLDYLQARGKVPIGGIIMKCSLKLCTSFACAHQSWFTVLYKRWVICDPGTNRGLLCLGVCRNTRKPATCVANPASFLEHLKKRGYSNHATKSRTQRSIVLDFRAHISTCSVFGVASDGGFHKAQAMRPRMNIILEGWRASTSMDWFKWGHIVLSIKVTSTRKAFTTWASTSPWVNLW